MTDYCLLLFTEPSFYFQSRVLLQGFQLLFYGDSITEQLRDLEEECGLWGCPEGGHISRKVFGQWRSINMAIGGACSYAADFMQVLVFKVLLQRVD